MASHVTGSHFNIWSERSRWYILSCRGDSDLHATSSRWYTFTRPTQPVEQTDNESICVKHLWVPTTPLPPFLAWGQLEHPRWPLLSESGKPLALSYQYSSVDLQLRRVRLLFPHMLICIRQHVWEMACWLPLLLVPKPTVASLSLSFFYFFLFFFFFFLRGKGFLIPGMPEKGPLRITLAKPLSLQEIHCLLKKVVGVENQGEVLFFLSFSLFPWKVITGLKKSPFFGTQVFLATAFHISPFLFFFFFFFSKRLVEF